MDSSMLLYWYDKPAGFLLLGITLVVMVILELCFKFCRQLTVARASAVDGANVRNSELQSRGITPPANNFIRWLIMQLCGLPSAVSALFRTTAAYDCELQSGNYNEGKGRELKMRFGPRAVILAGVGVRGEVSMDVFLKLDCTRSEGTSRSEGSTILQMMVEQVDIDITTTCIRNCSARNLSCGKKCDQFFVHKIEIQLCPSSWAQACHRLRLQPCTTPEVFMLQQMSTQSIQLPIGNPQQAGFTYQTGKTVSRSAALFEWLPATRDYSSKAVIWMWVLSRYADGTKLEFNKTIWGAWPWLGIQLPHMQMHPGLQASWEVLPDVELHEPQLLWDMTVIVHTALQRRRRWTSCVIQGPTITFKSPIHSDELHE